MYLTVFCLTVFCLTVFCLIAALEQLEVHKDNAFTLNSEIPSMQNM